MSDPDIVQYMVRHLPSGPVSRPSRVPHYAQQARHVNPMQFNAGPLSPGLASKHSTLDSAFCWRWCVHRALADTDPMSVKFWASIAGVGQYLFSPSQYFMLAGVRAHSLQHPNAV